MAIEDVPYARRSGARAEVEIIERVEDPVSDPYVDDDGRNRTRTLGTRTGFAVRIARGTGTITVQLRKGARTTTVNLTEGGRQEEAVFTGGMRGVTIQVIK